MIEGRRAAQPMVDDLPAGVQIEPLVLEGRVVQCREAGDSLHREDERQRPSGRHGPGIDAPGGGCGGGYRGSGYRYLLSERRSATICLMASSDRGSEASDQAVISAGVTVRFGPPS